MARVGMNPNRAQLVDIKLPPEIPVVAIVTHLPDTTSEYHRDRWEIVTSSLKLARKHVDTECHLLIWDNGSMPKLREWLFYEYKPDKLMFTENTGTQNTMRRIMSMYHDSIVAYSNDDILYYPAWLPEQIHILQTFPNVGAVSGCVTRYYMGRQVITSLAWAERVENKQIREIPNDWDFQHALSVGRAEEHISNEVKDIHPLLVEWNGAQAFVGGTHCQFVGYANRVYPLLYKSNKLMGELSPFDVRMDDAGLLRLLTSTRRTRHIGNRMTKEDREEIERLL